MLKHLRSSIMIIIAAAAVVSGAILLYQKNHVRPLTEKAFTEDLLRDKTLDVKTPKDISLLFVGDIMLSRNVADKIVKTKNPDLPFENVADLFFTADFSSGNLESPFSGRNNYASSGSLVFNAPTTTAQGLTQNHLGLLSLANNHALDQGLAGLIYTKNFLNSLGIKTVGAGENQEEAWQPAIAEIKGVKISFLAASYTSVNDGGKTRNEYVARTDDQENLKSAISNLKSQTDIIIILMHAGTEYTHEPNAAQIAFAHTAIDAGADIVIGSHPHWIQPVELYSPSARGGVTEGQSGGISSTSASPLKEEVANNDSPPLVGGVREGGHTGLIFYSLGNFIFDQSWSQETREGLAVKIFLKDRELEKAELLPVIMENNCCPRPANAEETERILNTIHASSTIMLSD